MVPIVPKITNFDECKPPDFMSFKLDKSDLAVYFDEKLLIETLKGGGSGLITSLFYNFIEIATNPVKRWAEFLTKEVGVQALKFAALGATGSGLKRLVEVKIENFSIEGCFSPSLRVSVERCKDVIDSFLDDQSFIAENPKAEVTCLITRTLIIHPTELRCKHIFSNREITEWVQNNRSCPTCRKTAEEEDFQYSYHTSMKVAFVVKRIFQRLYSFSAPEGVDIMHARNALRPIVESINEFNKNIYKGCRNHILKQYPKEFNTMIDVVDNWKDKVNIPID